MVNKLIFVDLDGVLADFDTMASRMGFDTSDLNKSSKHLNEAQLKVKQALYDSIAFSNFFADLPFMADGEQLWQFLKPHKPKVLTAAPSFRHRKDAATAHRDAGDKKREWCRNHLRIEDDNRVICTYSKKKREYAVDHSGCSAVLIDDRLQNVSEWENAGGIGILHSTAADTIKQLTFHLK